MKKMPFNEIENFIFENYHKRIGFSKENSYYLLKLFKKKELLFLASKLIEKITYKKEKCEISKTIKSDYL